MKPTVDATYLTVLELAFAKEGLEFLGAVRLREETAFGRFEHWLEGGRHAGMAYLENHRDLRRDPSSLLAGARTAIIFALPYYLGDKHDPTWRPLEPRVAQYARLRDYHKILWAKGGKAMAELHRYAASRSGEQAVGRVLVDSAPVLERALAERTKKGFIGKNTCYIHPDKGSFLLLGEVLTTLTLPEDVKTPVAPGLRTDEGGCGSCRRCQVNCPTGALDQDYTLDANKCLSYWTIEHRGTIPERFWPWLQYYYFGCDICQLVCPYNRKAKPVEPGADIRAKPLPDLLTMATMSQELYERHFGGTPLTRAKRHGLRRNALIAMTVRQDPRLDEALTCLNDSDHPSLLATAAQIRVWPYRSKEEG